MRQLIAIVVASALSGCTFGQIDPDYLLPARRHGKVEEAAESYAANLRWGRLGLAAARVHPAYRQEFMALVTASRRPFQFTDFEVVTVELGPERDQATAHALFSLYRLPSTREIQLADMQQWRYDARARRWYLEPDLELYSRAGL